MILRVYTPDPDIASITVTKVTLYSFSQLFYFEMLHSIK